MRWDKLYLHKSLGGFGFHDKEAFNNISQLGKEGWKLINHTLSQIQIFLLERVSWNPVSTTIQVIHGGVYGVPKTL